MAFEVTDLRKLMLQTFESLLVGHLAKQVTADLKTEFLDLFKQHDDGIALYHSDIRRQSFLNLTLDFPPLVWALDKTNSLTALDESFNGLVNQVIDSMSIDLYNLHIDIQWRTQRPIAQRQVAVFNTNLLNDAYANA